MHYLVHVVVREPDVAGPELLLRFAVERLARTHPLHARILQTAYLLPTTATESVTLSTYRFRACVEFCPQYVGLLSVDRCAELLRSLVDPWVKRLTPPPAAEPRAAKAKPEQRPSGPAPGLTEVLERPDGDEAGLETSDSPASTPSANAAAAEGNAGPDDDAEDPGGGAEGIASGPSGDSPSGSPLATPDGLERGLVQGVWYALSQDELESIEPSVRAQLTRVFGSTAGKLRERVTETRGRTLDWRRVLRQFVASCVASAPSFARPPRRIPHLVGIVPGRRLQPEKLRLTVVLDTSGSMSSDALSRIARELRTLARNADVTVIECDTVVRRIRQFHGRLSDVHGRGGTDLRPPFARPLLRQLRADALVYFTDGFGPAPAQPPAVPVLWCLLPGGRRPARWGRVARIRLGVR